MKDAIRYCFIGTNPTEIREQLTSEWAAPYFKEERSHFNICLAKSTEFNHRIGSLILIKTEKETQV